MIDPAKGAVRYGERVNLRGLFPDAPHADGRAPVPAREAGPSARWRPAGTNEHGRWTARVSHAGPDVARAARVAAD